MVSVRCAFLLSAAPVTSTGEPIIFAMRNARRRLPMLSEAIVAQQARRRTEGPRRLRRRERGGEPALTDALDEDERERGEEEYVCVCACVCVCVCVCSCVCISRERRERDEKR